MHDPDDQGGGGKWDSMKRDITYWKQYDVIAQSLLCTMAASLISNFVLQFFLYPAIERQTGEAHYGEILVFITIANVCGLAFGGAANGAYLTSRRHYQARSGDFFCILAGICAVFSVVAVVAFHRYLTGWVEGVCLALLITLTGYKSYSFVEFQLKKDYPHYLLFTSIIVVTEIACLPLFYLTRQWPVLLLPGMAVGIVYVCLRGEIYRRPMVRSEHFGQAARDTVTLSGAYLLDFGAQNADRFLLLPLLGGIAVTHYYVASLFSKTLSMITGPVENLILAYLSDQKEPFNRRNFLLINLFLLVGSVIFFGGVVLLGPWLLKLPFLYPNLVKDVRAYIPLASMAQLLLISSSIIVTIDLLVAPKRMQFILQVIYVGAYVALTIPFILYSGLEGFVIASCLAAAIRYAVAVVIGWIYISQENKRGYVYD